MKKLTNSIRTCRLAVLVVVIVALLFTSTTPALAAGKSDEVLLANSLEHYIQALTAYNNEEYSSVAGLLQAAASNAKHVDSTLADLLQQLRDGYKNTGQLDPGIASQIAIIYNSYNSQYGWNVPQFDPGNPTAVPGGDVDIT